MGSRRAPLLAGIGVALVLVGIVLFFILPKMGEVSDARTTLDEAETQQQTLESRKSALEDAQARAPEAKATIAEVDVLIPPVADEPGLLRLLNNTAIASGMDVATFTLSPGTFDEATGLSTITVAVAGSGSYFDVTEFMYKIETLPRAAKVTAMTLSPTSEGGGFTSTLSLTASIDLYTSDSSTGPGSIPGPQDATGGA